VLPLFDSTMHFTGNQYVKVEGNVAFAEHYAQAFHRTKPTDGKPAADWIVNVRYVDRLEKRDDEWKIADRIVVYDSERTIPVSTESAPLGDWNYGRRDRDDPSYEYGL
jgi:hypothetical protein